MLGDSGFWRIASEVLESGGESQPLVFKPCEKWEDDDKNDQLLELYKIPKISDKPRKMDIYHILCSDM
jgi:hypothetical protein